MILAIRHTCIQPYRLKTNICYDGHKQVEYGILYVAFVTDIGKFKTTFGKQDKKKKPAPWRSSFFFFSLQWIHNSYLVVPLPQQLKIVLSMRGKKNIKIRTKRIEVALFRIVMYCLKSVSTDPRQSRSVCWYEYTAKFNFWTLGTSRSIKPRNC